MAPIRIAHIVEAATGGVARHLIDLTTHLDPAEFTSALYLSLTRPESWREQLRGLRARGFLLREISLTSVPNPPAVRRLAAWARQNEIDVLHLHSAKAGYLGRLAARRTGLPAVYTPHAFPFQRATDPFRNLYCAVERRLAADTARIICVSSGEREEALRAGLSAEKLIVIPNGVDAGVWRPPTAEERQAARRALGIADEEIVIGALARFVPQKGIDTLLRAVATALTDAPRARIILWDDGPQRAMLRALAKRLSLPRVWFVGVTSDAW